MPQVWKGSNGCLTAFLICLVIFISGKKYSADSTATIYADSENSLWYDSINPDLTTSGVIAFDVSTEVANSADTQLQVQTGFWGTQTGIISLS